MHEAVMVVDENRETLELARRVLRNARYDVCVATNVQETLEMFDSFSPRLILTDMRFSGPVEAVDMVRRLRAKRAARTTAIVMVTTEASEAEAEAAIAAGCDDFISQPLSTPMLLGLVARWVSKDLAMARLSPDGKTWMSRLFGPARRRRTVVQIPSYKAGSPLVPTQHFARTPQRSTNG